MQTPVRQAVTQGHIDVSNVPLDTPLIAAGSDLARFFPDSPTGFREQEGGWSYPKTLDRCVIIAHRVAGRTSRHRIRL